MLGAYYWCVCVASDQVQHITVHLDVSLKTLCHLYVCKQALQCVDEGSRDGCCSLYPLYYKPFLCAVASMPCMTQQHKNSGGVIMFK
jgi:hypothetical protein